MDDNEIFSHSEPENEENKSLDLNSFSSGAVDDARKKRNRKKRGKQRFLKMFLTVFLVGIITVSLIAGSFLVYAFTMVDGTMDVDLNDLELNFTTAIYVEDKSSGEWVEYQRLHGEYNRIWVPYDEKAAKDKDNTEYTGIPQQLVDSARLLTHLYRYILHDRAVQPLHSSWLKTLPVIMTKAPAVKCVKLCARATLKASMPRLL